MYYRIFTTLLFCIFTCIKIDAFAADTLKFVVQPYLQFSGKTSIHILWQTNEKATGKVEYGPALKGAKVANLSQSTGWSEESDFHEIKLENLLPNTEYFWKVTIKDGNGQSVQSVTSTFKTAVNDGDPYMFALISDTQKNRETPWAWGKIAEKVWSKRPDFVIHAGDLVDKGRKNEDWTEHYFPYGSPLMQRTVIFPVLGNHEQDADNYYKYTVAPKPEYYYTFTYGNAQFFMLDSNRDIKKGSKQYIWLQWELAKSNATWKIVVLHHPPYTSDHDDYGNTDFALSERGSETRQLCGLFDEYGVDFCFYGHTHLYERTWPVKANKINMEDGVVYVNAGGAGGYIEKFAPTRSWFTAELEAVHHYCTFAVFEDNIVAKTWDYEGRLIDAYSMKKIRKLIVQLMPAMVKIESGSKVFKDTLTVRCFAPNDDVVIKYTLDGSEPQLNSDTYKGPVLLHKSSVFCARAMDKNGRMGEMNSMSFSKLKPLPSVAVSTPENGVNYTYYEGDFEVMPDFKSEKMIRKGKNKDVTLRGVEQRDNQFALVFEGYIFIKKEGKAGFYLNSDDGSKLYIHDQLVIDHGGQHGTISKTGEIILEQGYHPFRIEYFEAFGSQYLEAGYIDHEGKETAWKDSDLWIEGPTVKK